MTSFNPSMNKDFIQKLTEIIEANLANEKFGIEDLAKEMGMSHSNLHRKLHSALNQNISQFIREIRLKKAKELLLSEELTVSEISYRVGFGSPTYFNKCFRAYFRISPLEYRSLETKDNASIDKPENKISGSIKKRQKPLVLLTSIVVVISAIILIVVFQPLSGKQKIKELTIAVLPFVDLSPGKGNTYIINGLREEICNNLEIIKGLKVKSRTDTDKFMESGLSTREIAGKLNVKYILTGNGQNVDEKIRFRLQLIDAGTGNNIWWNTYQTELSKLTSKGIFEIQEEAAISIAEEINEILTSKGNQLSSNYYKDSLPAEKLFSRGEKYLEQSAQIYDFERSKVLLFKAKNLFEQAIKLDSTFAPAYARLGSVYSGHLYYNPDIYLSERYLDSALLMANKALIYDHRNTWAKGIIADYYLKKGLIGEFDEAHKVFDNVINSSEDLFEFWTYVKLEDSYHAIIYFYKTCEKPNSSSYISQTFQSVLKCYSEMGYPEISKKLAEKIINNTKDSLTYYINMLDIELLTGNFKSAVQFGLKTSRIDQGDLPYGKLLQAHLYLRDYSMAYKYLQKVNNPLKVRNYIEVDIMMGEIYLRNGKTREANVFFENALKNCQLEIKHNRINAQNYYSQFYLACIYAARGEKRKAIDNIKFLKKRETNPLWLVIYLKQSPFLDNIRKEPEFATILRDVETKYEKAHLAIGEMITKKNFTVEF